MQTNTDVANRASKAVSAVEEALAGTNLAHKVVGNVIVLLVSDGPALAIRFVPSEDA